MHQIQKGFLNVAPLAVMPGSPQLVRHTPPVNLILFALFNLFDICHLFLSLP